MEPLTFLGYAFLALLYFVVGYHIAILSRHAANNWENSTEYVSISCKILLYPMNAMNLIMREDQFEGVVGNDTINNVWYVILHLFFWPFRIAWNIIIWALATVGTYVLSVFAFAFYISVSVLHSIKNILFK